MEQKEGVEAQAKIQDNRLQRGKVQEGIVRKEGKFHSWWGRKTGG